MENQLNSLRRIAKERKKELRQLHKENTQEQARVLLKKVMLCAEDVANKGKNDFSLSREAFPELYNSENRGLVRCLRKLLKKQGIYMSRRPILCPQHDYRRYEMDEIEYLTLVSIKGEYKVDFCVSRIQLLFDFDVDILFTLLLLVGGIVLLYVALFP